MKKILSLGALIHIIMVAFAAASLGNVREFFVSAGHPSEVAWALAVALGLGLVTLAIMLTRIDREAEPDTFKWLVIAASTVGLMSGCLQSSAYSRHLSGAWPLLLGFGGPLVGEVLLAVAASAYGKAKRRAEFRGVGENIEAAVSTFLVDAIDSMDRTLIQKNVEKAINRMAITAVSSVSQKAMRFYEQEREPAQIEQAIVQLPVQESVQLDAVQPCNMPNYAKLNGLERANEQRRIDRLNAQTVMLNAYRDNPDASLRDVAKMVDKSPGTIRNWLKELEEQNMVTVNGSVHVHRVNHE